MTDVIELSSDEEYCVPCKDTYKEYLDSDTIEDTDISDILKKYSKLKEKYNIPVRKNSPKQDSTDDDISDIHPLKEKLRSKYDTISECSDIFTSKYSADKLFASNSEPIFTNDENGAPKAKKRKSKDSNDKEIQKLEKERLKAEKQAEKERKKAENDRAKAEKQALASAYKNLKPEECIKYITAFVDTELISHLSGTDIPNALQAANMAYKIVSNVHPFTITWSRKRQPQLTTISGQLSLTNNQEVCNDVLLIILWNEFANLVHEKKVCSHMELKQNLYPNKKINLGIFGLENYFSHHKSKKSKDKAFADIPKVSRQDVDMALIELQIMFDISHRMLETPQHVSAMIAQFTKSIALLPYRLHKQQNQKQMEWYVAGDNKDCVRVDKNGNGLSRLWQQQLTQFTLARLETAEAIASQYPCPASLMRAYKECTSKEQCEKLLQDIPVRRAAGPLTSVRKIGPELSKKVHTLFTSTDGNALL